MTIRRNHPNSGTGTPMTSLKPPPEARLKPAVSTLAQLDLPETLRYRIKNRLLGPPIATERQSTERLGKPTALAVLSSDVISSSAYATEQMLIPPDPDHRRCCILLGHPHQHRGDFRSSLRDPLLPRGGQGVHEGRGRLRGGPRELRPQRGPSGRHVVAYRLHLDGGGLGGGRRGRHHLRLPEPHSLYDLDRHRPGHSSGVRQSARNPGSRPHVRRPHLLLHRQYGAPHRLGALQDCDWVPPRPCDHRTPRLGPRRDGGKRSSLRSQRVSWC